jgi:hypothetical protein
MNDISGGWRTPPFGFDAENPSACSLMAQHYPYGRLTCQHTIRWTVLSLDLILQERDLAMASIATQLGAITPQRSET